MPIPSRLCALLCCIVRVWRGSSALIIGLLLALAAYILVGAVIPLLTSRYSGEDGMRFRTGAGQLAGFVLDSLRGLSETLQYGQGAARLEQMDRMTDQLSEEEARLKRTAGRNAAATNLVILLFDLAMLFCLQSSVRLFRLSDHYTGADELLWALRGAGSIGQHPAKYLCGGQPGAGYPGRIPGSGGRSQDSRRWSFPVQPARMSALLTREIRS